MEERRALDLMAAPLFVVPTPDSPSLHPLKRPHTDLSHEISAPEKIKRTGDPIPLCLLLPPLGMESRPRFIRGKVQNSRPDGGLSSAPGSVPGPCSKSGPRSEVKFPDPKTNRVSGVISSSLEFKL